MKTKISIVGLGDFIDIAKRVVESVYNRPGIDVNVLECRHGVAELIPEIEEHGTDIIITGRLNKVLMERKTAIPVINLNITPTDILIALKKLLPHFNRIAIALPALEDLEYDYSLLPDLLDIELTYITYATEIELDYKMGRFARTDGAVIGTGTAVDSAKKFGLQGILIYSQHSVTESIERAIEIVHFKRAEEWHNQQLSAIIHSVKDGIIATNELDQITLVNNSARELLQLKSEALLGKHVSHIVANRELATQEDFQNKILEFNNRKLNTNKISVLQRDSKIGNVITFQDITEIQKIEQQYRLENEAKGFIAKNQFGDIVTSNPRMLEVIVRAKKFAKSDSTVLIVGPTGTGKELFAQSIHNGSARKSHPFVAINCAALPEALLESELFGYEDGAFTGASRKGKKGLFEIAHNGTILLDEINSVSLHFQARLLRVLQEKEVVRVGGSRVVPINVRVIAATNEDLTNLVEEGKFRADLYYRINVLKITVPSLNERVGDILHLTRQFLVSQSKENYERIEPFLEDMCCELERYMFPGNIRQLHNILERFSVLCDFCNPIGREYVHRILVECLDQKPAASSQVAPKIEFELQDSYQNSMMEAEKRLLTLYLDKLEGDKSMLANQLGMSRTTLYRKLRDLKIE